MEEAGLEGESAGMQLRVRTLAGRRSRRDGVPPRYAPKGIHWKDPATIPKVQTDEDELLQDTLGGTSYGQSALSTTNEGG